MNDSELMAYCETVQCIYEYCLEMFSKDIPDSDEEKEFFRQIREYRDRYGIVAVRDRMRDKMLVSAVEEGWEQIKEDGEYCFDWEYVPAFLNRCIGSNLELRQDWRWRLAGKFPELAGQTQKADVQ